MADSKLIPELPFSALAEYTKEIANRDILSQTPVAGNEELRQNIADLLSKEGIKCSSEELMILTGSQQGIDIVARILIQPGDVVVVEAPTYFLALQTFKTVGAHIIEVPILYRGSDKEMIIKLLDEAISKDQEGVMVNISNAPYECKRTKNILKVKKMQTCDLRIVGFEKGEGKNTGTLGRINVNYKGNIVGVGSGFTDEMRNEIWNNQDKYIGKITEVQYFEETTNSKDDKLSLRFPVFLEVRWDKTEESYY
jgi:signal peptidase I